MSKKPVKPIAKIKTLMGQPHNREFVDFDYLDKLSPADLSWLAQFSDAHYAGAKNGFTTDEQRQEANKARYKRY